MKKTSSAHESDLLERLRSLDSLAVAFSGGVDSTYLAAAAHDVLGDRAIAITVDSEAYPPESIIETRQLATLIGIHLVEIPAEVCAIPEFAANEPDRCYHCKKALFSLIRQEAAGRGVTTVADGTNADDHADYRPGERALAEMGVISPLKDAGLTKAEIRRLSRERGLPTWNKPSFACLASRFPYGTRITPDLLRRVADAEALLRDMGCHAYRVRHHGDIARIEVAPEDMALIMEPTNRERIIDHLHALGYAYIALDLAGYRTGSMNETL